MRFGSLLHYLSRTGPQPARRLREALGLTTSSFHREVASIDEVLVAGRGRATWYAARREIAGVTTPIDGFELDAAGDVRLAFRLHPVEPFGHYVESCCEDVEGGFHEADPATSGPGIDLPWFLRDVAPAGFLGRSWIRAHAEEGFPADLVRWSGDHVLRYAVSYGDDLAGAFVLGRFALQRREERQIAVDAVDFPAGAERALAAAAIRSSIGGDQPKFLVSSPEGGSIVKFSPPLDTAGGRRWADLLAAEHIVHEVLRDCGFATPRSTLVDAGGRRFLEVPRFDRHGPIGRSGTVSLFPLDADGVGSDLRRWSLVTARLVAEGRLSADDHRRVVWLEAFGALIANTDMHLGNLSLRLRGSRIEGLAPIYDMLPMFYAPGFGGEVGRGRHRHALERIPDGALAAARRVWVRVASHPEISADFREIASEHAGR